MKKLIAVLTISFVFIATAMAQDTSLYRSKKRPQPLPLNDTISPKTDSLKYKPWKQNSIDKYKPPKNWPDTTKRTDTLRKENQP